MPGLEFREIARLLSCEEFARREMEMRGNRARCPFHNGENFNLAFYNDNRCHCFKCNRTADVVQLAAQQWNTSQREAARLLNDEFSLGLRAETPTAEQREQVQRQREERATALQQERNAWAAACDEQHDALAALDGAVHDADSADFWKKLRRVAAARERLNVLEASWQRR